MLLLQNDRQCLQPQQRSAAAVQQLASACRQASLRPPQHTIQHPPCRACHKSFVWLKAQWLKRRFLHGARGASRGKEDKG